MYSVLIILLIGVALVFEKAGEKWWKALIPFYCEWTEAKLAGAPTSWYWILVASFVAGGFVSIVAFILFSIGEAVSSAGGSGTGAMVASLFVGFMGFVLFVPGYIFYGRILYKLSQRFGKGLGFALGLLFLAPIFWMILALDDSRYQADSLARGMAPQNYPGYQGGYQQGGYQNYQHYPPVPSAQEAPKKLSRGAVVGFVLLILIPIFTCCVLAEFAANLSSQAANNPVIW